MSSDRHHLHLRLKFAVLCSDLPPCLSVFIKMMINDVYLESTNSFKHQGRESFPKNLNDAVRLLRINHLIVENNDALRYHVLADAPTVGGASP
jgi:hypothetical protein